MIDLEFRLDRLSSLLGAAECPACVSMREQQAGGLCPECDDSVFDLRESSPMRLLCGDRTTFLALQSAFEAYECGQAGMDTVAGRVRQIRDCALRGADIAARVLYRGGLSEPVYALLMGAVEQFNAVEQHVMACLSAAQRGDLFEARREMETVGSLLRELDGLRGSAEDVQDEVRAAA